MEEVRFVEPISCTVCRAAFLKLKKGKKARFALVSERKQRAPCRGCPSLAVYEKGGV